MTPDEEHPARSYDLVRRPEEAIYRACYSPVDLRDMLATAETRARIRKLPAVQVFFGLKELDEEEIAALIPHVTREQWQAVIDLDVWERATASTERFLSLQRHLLAAEDAVARKLVAAADRDLWELLLRRQVTVHRKIYDDLEGEPKEGEQFETPDNRYLLVLPKNPEVARLLRAVILRLYALNPEWTALTLESAINRTRLEIMETAYQSRTARVEEMGFQDYFDAIGIYTPLYPGERLPRKRDDLPEVASELPAPETKPTRSPLLLVQVLAAASQAGDVGELLEELFFVCNKLLTADRTSPSSPKSVRRGIKKAVAGISLGLEIWSDGHLDRAAAGVRSIHLQSFFQRGYAELLLLRKRARELADRPVQPSEPLEQAFLQSLVRAYPMRVVRKGTGFRRRFFERRAQLEAARQRLETLGG